MFLLAKYNTQTVFTFPMIKRGVIDFAVTADWTPATGDTKISKDGGNVANTTNNPAAVGGTGSALWTLTLTATELQAAVVDIQIIDSATKAVEDQFFKIYTYGNASAKIIVDLSDTVRLGLTSLPNAAAEAAGGLYTRGTGAGQINQPANGQVDANTVKIGGTTQTAGDVGSQVAAIKAKTDLLPDGIKKNTALSNFAFLMVDSTDHISAKTGLTITATRSIDGAAFAACANSASEISNGIYKINLANTDLNGDMIVLRFTGSGADDRLITIITET